MCISTCYNSKSSYKENSMPRLENWEPRIVIDDPVNEYRPPETKLYVIIGGVYDHPAHSDGTVITTTYVRQMNALEGWALTRNTRYILGKPTEVYQRFIDEQMKKNARPQ